jgi:hypothetical protein
MTTKAQRDEKALCLGNLLYLMFKQRSRHYWGDSASVTSTSAGGAITVSASNV